MRAISGKESLKIDDSCANKNIMESQETPLRFNVDSKPETSLNFT